MGRNGAHPSAGGQRLLFYPLGRPGFHAVTQFEASRPF